MPRLALGSVKSFKEFVLLGENHHFISDHDNGAEASKALAQYVKDTGREAAIYRRTADAWVKH
jgi:hypothetical protein